jgi:hypothetical protein
MLGERLRHERRVDALLDRHLLDDRAERHDVVRRRERVRVPQIDLVLTGAGLVVTELDRDAEILEHANRPTPEVVSGSARHVVEEAGRVDRHRRPVDELRGLQQVELDLRVRVEREPAVGRLGQRALEHVARVGQ